MAVQFVGASAIVEGTTILSVPYPSGIANGDLALVFVVNKYPAASPSSPSGWNTDPKASGGAGSAGEDSGDVQVSMYSRQLDGSESGTVDFTISGGDSAVAVMLNFRRYQGSGSWDVSLNTAADNAAGASYSATQGYSLGVMDNDLYIVVTGLNANPARSSAPAFTQNGVNTTRPLVWANGGTNNGDDVSVIAVGWYCTGSDSGEGTYSDTLVGDAASTAAGVSFFLRFRQSGGTFSLPVVDGQARLSGHAATINVDEPDGGDPRTITCSTAVLSSSGRAASVLPGAVSIAADTAAMTAQGATATVTSGGVVVATTAAVLASSGTVADVIPGGVHVGASAAAIDSAGLGAAIASGAAVVVQVAQLGSAGRAASVVPGRVSVQVAVGALTSDGRTASTGAGPAPQTIACAVAVIASAGRVSSVVPGAVTVQASVAQLDTAGALVIVMSGETLIVAGLGVLGLAGESASIVPGAISVSAGAGVLDTVRHVVSIPTVIACRVAQLTSAGAAASVDAAVVVLAGVARLGTGGHDAQASAPHAFLHAMLAGTELSGHPVSVFAFVIEPSPRNVARVRAAERMARVASKDRKGEA